MKIHSLFWYGRRIFCPVLVSCALASTPNAHAHQSIRQTTTSFFYQQQQVSGTVSDISGPLAGVTIRVKGKQAVSLTDAQGKYSIDAGAGDVLVFSYVGYKEQSITVTAGNVIDVLLEEDATSLQEVTVNAGYYKVKDKERTGSIAKISAKDIETQPVTNVLATMQGRMAGVNITQTTGVSGGGFDIQIRGQNSLRAEGNSPLYIIDGVPYSSEAIGHSQTSGVLPTSSSPLNSINPSDIESLEVLKDADATAIKKAWNSTYRFRGTGIPNHK